MSDQDHRDPDYDQDDQDLELSTLYRRVSDEQPSAALDEAVMRLAAEAVSGEKEQAEHEHARHRAYGPFTLHWPRIGAVAAMVLLSVILVNTIEREGDKEFSDKFSVAQLDEASAGKPQAGSVSGDAGELKKKREQNAQIKAPPVAAESKVDLPLISDESMEPMSEPADEEFAARRKRLAATGAEADSETGVDLMAGRRDDNLGGDGYYSRLPETRKRAARIEAGQVISANKDLSQPGVTTVTTTISKGEAAGLSEKMQKIKPATSKAEAVAEADTQSAVGAARQLRDSDALANVGEQSVVPAQQEKAIAGLVQPAENLTQAIAPLAQVPAPAVRREQEQRMLEKKPVAKPKPKAKSDTSASAPRPAPAKQNLSGVIRDNEKKCINLSMQQCLQSGDCTFERRGRAGDANLVAVCRAAVNHCEQDFRQGVDTASQCRHKPGCDYQSATEDVPASCIQLKQTP